MTPIFINPWHDRAINEFIDSGKLVSDALVCVLRVALYFSQSTKQPTGTYSG